MRDEKVCGLCPYCLQVISGVLLDIYDTGKAFACGCVIPEQVRVVADTDDLPF
jgi:hypothetical protein